MDKLIGIVGAGTMGAGIMINFVTHGYRVVLMDRSTSVLDKAHGNLVRFLARQVEKGTMTTSASNAAMSRLSCATEMSALSECSVVIEAVFEDLGLKQRLFSEIEDIVSADALLASNTSCLRIEDIGSALSHKARFCGLHYFSPAAINPVVELVAGPQTSTHTIETARELLENCEKEAIQCKDSHGFALNRFFCPYTNEAVNILDEGIANKAQIDQVAQETLGVALGPFAVMNIIGTATSLKAMCSLEPLGAFYKPASTLSAVGAHNTPWNIEDDCPPVDKAAFQMISERLVHSILKPVEELLSEGVASLADIDKGAALAFRFSRLPSDLMAD